MGELPPPSRRQGRLVVRRVAIFVALFAVALAACGPRSPHAVTDAFVSAVNRHDVEAAKKLLVSPEQLAQVIECPPNSHATWNMPSGRRERVTKQLASYASHDPSRGQARLGALWEEYDNPAQWHSYKPGDAVGDSCHAKAAFEVQNYRIQLELTDSFGSKVVSTKPVELWKIDGGWYVWDDPFDTEGW